MKAPKGLGGAGKALWASVLDGLPEGWELDEREGEILTLAARQRDDLAKLEEAIKATGAMTTGSAGQPVVNPAITEARQARLAIARHLGALDLPDEEEKPKSAASKRATKAARARWDRN